VAPKKGAWCGEGGRKKGGGGGREGDEKALAPPLEINSGKSEIIRELNPLYVMYFFRIRFMYFCVWFAWP